MRNFLILLSLMVLVLNTTCTAQHPKGSLFIIGGGKRPLSLMKEMTDKAKLEKGYGLILPQSSGEPDSSAYYVLKQFDALGFRNVGVLQGAYQEEWSDSLKNASLIYMTGGDQNRFMSTFQGSPLKQVIQTAYQNGAMIAGTSAGAALMSEQMISGDERHYPDYRDTNRHIEEENVIYKPGLGLLQHVLVDQHFIKRSRYNRLIATAIEYPSKICVGIDESTALYVKGEKGLVVGESQVVWIRALSGKKSRHEKKLGHQNLGLKIYLPGEEIDLREVHN
ncbi:cyanophycinase [Persicobacter sp. CCB-QB2]|uniref:cyanophycinase n=1 Tax=Persicobacter sp. CCB-QB2 TaxID=1561025 RepID=UPI0006A9A94C|nr:cyanophycinase [Persicobacter sp. CCB-QB2]